MPTPANRTAIVAAYFLIYVVWGSTYYFIGVALEGFPPFLLGAMRFSAAGIMLLTLCHMSGERVWRRSLLRRSAVSGIVLLFVDMAVIMLAQRYVSSSLVAIVASSTAIWIMVLDVPMWRRNFRSASTVSGMAIGFVGVGLLYAEQLAGDKALGTHGDYGILILIGGCVSWALGSLYAKYRSSRVERVNAFAGAAWQMLFAGAMFWMWAAVTGETAHVRLDAVSTLSWLSLAYLVVCGSMLAYTAYVWLLKVRPAAEVATHAYVNPVVAVVIGAVAGEHITLVQLAGLAIILASVMLVNGLPRRRDRIDRPERRI